MKNQKGFTLIETLIYITIIGAVVSGFINFALSISNSRSKTYAVQEVQANSRIAFDLISQKIRLAEDVILPLEGNSTNTLTLDMSDPDPNLTFNLENGILGITEGVGQFIPITSSRVNISNLNFTNLAVEGERDNIGVEITIEYRNQGSREYEYLQNLQTSVSLRR